MSTAFRFFLGGGTNQARASQPKKCSQPWKFQRDGRLNILQQGREYCTAGPRKICSRIRKTSQQIQKPANFTENCSNFFFRDYNVKDAWRTIFTPPTPVGNFTAESQNFYSRRPKILQPAAEYFTAGGRTFYRGVRFCCSRIEKSAELNSAGGRLFLEVFVPTRWGR